MTSEPRIVDEITKIVAMPAVRQNLIAQGMDPQVIPSEQLGEVMKAEAVKFANIIRTANIRIEQ